MKIFLNLFLIFILFSLCFSSIIWAEEWVLFSRYEDFFLYDKDNINYPYEKRKEIIGVWQKTVYDKNSVVRISGHLGDKYGDLVESISLIEMDCRNRYAQTKAITYYNTKGKVIDTKHKTDPDWKKIVDGTPMDKLYRVICLSKPKSPPEQLMQ